MKEPAHIERAIDLRQALQQKSCFLFGPRQTGKSWIIRNTLGPCRLYNLLDTDTFLRLSRSPRILREECTPQLWAGKYIYVFTVGGNYAQERKGKST